MNEPTTEDLLKAYREARAALTSRVDQLFPAGSRVQPIGVKSGNWRATVKAVASADRIRIAGDMVWLDWDNGNRFETAIDEIELTRPPRKLRQSGTDS